jgi:CPA2 family monovalent cation:H+ antiporter-2
MLSDRLADSAIIQPLLAATVVSMVLSPLLIRHNGRLAELIFPRTTPPPVPDQAQLGGQRDHVVICGFGRVGQNLARVLDRQGFAYVALDCDPRAVEFARRAGDAVVYGDGTATEILEAIGLERCRVLVLTFAETTASMKIVRSVRELRPDLPILVRTQDDTKLEELQQAGATEVVPETLEASLMLASHVLLLLDVPVSRVVKTVGDIRNNRYSMLRRLFRRDDSRMVGEDGDMGGEELHTVVLPPGAYCVGKSLADLKLEGDEVTITAIRRDGILGQQPEASTVLREGDVVILAGTPEALEHGEARLLMG